MRAVTLGWLLLAGAAGCHPAGKRISYPIPLCPPGEAAPAGPVASGEAGPDMLPPPQELPPGGTPGCPPPCPPAAPPQAQAPCPPQVEYHVQAPRQAARAPGAAAAQAASVERQEIVHQQVILVPQRVLVPFVQATNFGAIRVNGLSQTQIANALGVAANVGTAEAAAAGVTAAGAQAGGAAQAAAPAAEARAAGLTAREVELILQVLERCEQRVTELEKALKERRAETLPEPEGD
ncbi:MAG TPA: hypothetical protein VIL46_10920 [Gemmataceae bacterium]